MYTFSAPLVYRSDKVENAEEVLKSWNGLWDPMFEGGTIMLPSTYQAFSFTMASVLGVDPLTEMDQVWAKFEELKPNILGLVPDTDVVNGLISGDCWVAQTIPGNGLAAEDEGAPIGYIVPEEGNYIDRDFYYVLTGIDDATKYYADLFANYICEAKVQTPMADELGVIPGQPEARLPKYMAEMPEAFPATEEELANSITLNLQAAAENADEFQAKYDESLK
jgi:spermidine/putrescine-binding protein